MLIVKIIENNIMYSMQELHLSIFLVKVTSAIFTSSIFSVHSSTDLSTIFSCTYDLHSPNTDQHHMIYHIHTHNYQDSKQIPCYIHLYQLTLCIRNCIYDHSNVVYYYKRLHLIYIYTYTFRVILCVLLHSFLTSQ